MITFVTGKPGDGKSMYGMRVISRSLLESERVIVTNIAVKVPELREFLCAKGWEGDLNERLIILRHEEVFEFYRFRSGGYVLPPSPDWVAAKEEGGRKLKRPEFIAAMQAQLDIMKQHPEACKPCEYHIDEAHDYFSAREWADTGRGVLWYASKHRHLHDECVFYTQVMANVEKQLRGLASETIRVRNQIRMSWGPFRKAPIFRVYHYYGAPEKLESATAYNTAVMTLDVNGLAKTYNSAGALSVHATPEKIKNRAPLPYWALPLAIAIGVVVVTAVLALAPVTLGKWAGNKIASAADMKAKAPEKRETTQQGVVQRVMAGVIPQARPTEEKPVETPEPKRTVMGTMQVNGVTWVSIRGRGWQRVIQRAPDGRARLQDGTIVAAEAVRAGTDVGAME